MFDFTPIIVLLTNGRRKLCTNDALYINHFNFIEVYKFYEKVTWFKP